MKQQLNQAQFKVKYNSTLAGGYPYLNISFTHKKYNSSSPYLLNFEFVKPEDLVGKEFDIWQTSNQTEFDAPIGKMAGSILLS